MIPKYHLRMLGISRPTYSFNRYVSVAWKPKKETLEIEKIAGKYNMVMVAGGGGSERSMAALRNVLYCAGAPFSWEVIKGDFVDDKEFANLVLAVERNGLAIKGKLDNSEDTTAILEQFEMKRNMSLRRNLDLHTFIVEVKSFKGLKHMMKLHQEVDVTVVRQNTEGAYTLLEHSPLPGKVAELIRVITMNNSRRLAENAFQYAIRKKRKKVMCLHRADVMPLSESMYLEAFLEVAERYKEVEHEVVRFTQAFTLFMQDPKYFDVVVMSGLDGQMLMNYLLGMIGGESLAAGLNVGDGAAVAEPAARRQDRDTNNPTAYFLSAALLLDLLNRPDMAAVIRDSIDEVFLDKVLPDDLGGKATLEEFTEAVVKKIRATEQYRSPVSSFWRNMRSLFNLNLLVIIGQLNGRCVEVRRVATSASTKPNCPRSSITMKDLDTDTSDRI